MNANALKAILDDAIDWLTNVEVVDVIDVELGIKDQRVATIRQLEGAIRACRLTMQVKSTNDLGVYQPTADAYVTHEYVAPVGFEVEVGMGMLHELDYSPGEAEEFSPVKYEACVAGVWKEVLP